MAEENYLVEKMLRVMVQNLVDKEGAMQTQQEWVDNALALCESTGDMVIPDEEREKIVYLAWSLYRTPFINSQVPGAAMALASMLETAYKLGVRHTRLELFRGEEA